MSIKSTLTDKKLLINAVAIVVVAFILIFFTQNFLDLKTNHGETITVPDLHSKTIDQVEQILSDNNLRFKIIDSSTFSRKLPKNSVLRQDPKAGSLVKDGRMIYLTINPSGQRFVNLPKLTDRPHREAIAAISSAGLKFGRFVFSHGRYNAENMVLEAKYKGEEINYGDKIAKLSVIDLVLDYGGKTETTIPNLVGERLEIGKNKLIDLALNLGTLNYDEEFDEGAKYFIYSQSPEYIPGKSTPKGSRVNLYLTQDQNKALRNTEEEEITVPEVSEEESEEIF